MSFINRFFLTIFTVTLLFSLSTHVAFAHGNLLQSDPPSNAVLEKPPEKIQMLFSEPLEPGYSQAAVLDKSGNRVDKRDSLLDTSERRNLAISVPPLSTGSYVVAWQVLSSIDGHLTGGSFSFSIGPPPEKALQPESVSPQVEKDKALNFQRLWEPVMRWLNFLGLMVIVGGMFFQMLLLRPASIAALPEKISKELRKKTWQRYSLMFAVAIVLILLSALGSLAVQAATLGASPFAILPLRWGQIWMERTAIIILLAVYFLYERAANRTSGLLFKSAADNISVALILLALVVSNSLTSHAATVPSGATLAIGFDSLHLLASSLWIGGLFNLGLVALPGIKILEKKRQHSLLQELVPRFSRVAMGSVAALLISGIFHSWLGVGSLEVLFRTSYGWTLLFKIIFILLLLFLGAINLLRVTPRLKDSEGPTRLLALVRLEVMFSIVVLLLAGILTSISPGRTALQSSGPKIERKEQAEDVKIRLSIAPGQAGINTFRVEVTDRKNKPLPDVREVAMAFRYLNSDLAESELIARPREAGIYEVFGSPLSIVGPWRIEVIVKRTAAYEAQAFFNLDIPERAASTAPPQPDVSLRNRLVRNLTVLALGSLAYLAIAFFPLKAKAEKADSQ